MNITLNLYIKLPTTEPPLNGHTTTTIDNKTTAWNNCFVEANTRKMFFGTNSQKMLFGANTQKMFFGANSQKMLFDGPTVGALNAESPKRIVWKEIKN